MGQHNRNRAVYALCIVRVLIRGIPWVAIQASTLFRAIFPQKNPARATIYTQSPYNNPKGLPDFETRVFPA